MSSSRPSTTLYGDSFQFVLVLLPLKHPPSPRPPPRTITSDMYYQSLPERLSLCKFVSRLLSLPVLDMFIDISLFRGVHMSVVLPPPTSSNPRPLDNVQHPGVSDCSSSVQDTFLKKENRRDGNNHMGSKEKSRPALGKNRWDLHPRFQASSFTRIVHIPCIRTLPHLVSPGTFETYLRPKTHFTLRDFQNLSPSYTSLQRKWSLRHLSNLPLSHLHSSVRPPMTSFGPLFLLLNLISHSDLTGTGSTSTIFHQPKRHTELSPQS